MATTCEPHRTSPYSEDLRWRMVWQREIRGLKIKQVASNLGVDPATVSRVVSKFQLTGKVNNSLGSRVITYHTLTEPIQLILIDLLLSRPGIYLHEIASALFEQTGAIISPACICRFIKKMQFTRQRLKITARQRDNFLRAKYALEVNPSS